MTGWREGSPGGASALRHGESQFRVNPLVTGEVWLAILRLVSQRDRAELSALLKKAESHRLRISELQKQLALLMQKIARVGSRVKSDDGTRKSGPPRRYK